MEKYTTYQRSLPMMAGLAIAISVGVGVAGGHVIASIDAQQSETSQVSEMNRSGGYTVVYKDPDGPWPGERKTESRALEVAAGVFVNPDKGFDI